MLRVTALYAAYVITHSPRGPRVTVGSCLRPRPGSAALARAPRTQGGAAHANCGANTSAREKGPVAASATRCTMRELVSQAWPRREAGRGHRAAPAAH